jgi:nucleoside-diphosphate-sugar epimerase
VEESAHSINRNPRILVSRNRPLAFVVGVAGFLGSYIAEQLIEKGIQVLGIDDLSSGSKDNLENLTKEKDFHFINESISTYSMSSLGRLFEESVPRIDYAIFAAHSPHLQELYGKGLLNFFSILKLFKGGKLEDQDYEKNSKVKFTDKPKIAFISSVDLYNNKLEGKLEGLRDGEIHFARQIKHLKLNGRVIRLGALYGPRMNFDQDDPTIRLIQASLNNELPSEQTNLDFSSRAMFVSDAVKLIIKSLLVGSTAQKIYDGALFQPVKISEIRQVLLDPLWYEEKGFKPSELPPWPTPNLVKTMKELSWKPHADLVSSLKETISYFKTHDQKVPILEKEDWKKDFKRWSFYNEAKEAPESDKNNQLGEKDKFNISKDATSSGKTVNFFTNLKLNSIYFVITALIILGLILPLGQLLVGGVMIRANLKSSANAITEGNFKKAREDINLAKGTLEDTRKIINSLALIKRVGILEKQIDQVDEFVSIIDDGMEGAYHAVSGTEALFQTTKIISGEAAGEPQPLYSQAQIELTTAGQKIDKLKSKLRENEFVQSLPEQLKPKVGDFIVRLNIYSNLVDKARAASFIIPEITGVSGRKSYLVLIQNNLELRATGGFIGSYAKLDFENGKISNIKVDDIYNLDGGLQEVILPPTFLSNDLGQQRLYLRDSNYEPDFPTSARTAQVFYRKEAGESVNGVLALDLSGSGKLLDAVGGLDLPEYGEHVSGENLFEKAITHAEVGFFPGSQAKKNYLTSLQTQLFNKLFYLSNQNWPAIIKALSDNLEQKHLLIYLSDPVLFSYVTSENWGGVMPRGVEDPIGETHDFLAIVESNMGANKSNFYLNRTQALSTSIGKDGQIFHTLKVDYQNNSVSEVFPGGKYKNRFRIYLPLGAKLTKASLGEVDLLPSFNAFSDYGRTGYTSLFEINPKEKKTLILDYTLPKPLAFVEGKVKYRLDVIKQAGTNKDPFEWTMTYPINYDISQENSGALTSAQELKISTELIEDRSFTAQFAQK